jgi:hypothetical protein
MGNNPTGRSPQATFSGRVRRDGTAFRALRGARKWPQIGVITPRSVMLNHRLYKYPDPKAEIDSAINPAPARDRFA